MGTYAGPRRSLQGSKAVNVLRPVARALDHIHDSGFVYRNVAPHHILLTERALSDPRYSEEVKLVDLRAAGMIPTREVAGPRVDHRSDIWSLAVVAFEMLTGRHPFPANNLMARYFKITHGPVPSPRQLNPELPPACDGVFARAFAKDRDERYSSASAFVDALTEALERPVVH